MQETIRLIYIISVIMPISMLLIDLIIVYVKGRITQNDWVGSLIIVVISVIPIIQWIIFIWLIFDIKKEMLK